MENKKHILREIYSGPEAPQIGIYLSYAIFPEIIRSIDDINPFGHLAIGFKNPSSGKYLIATPRQNAIAGQENLFLYLSPADYFYGSEDISGAIHGSQYGMAFARTTLALHLGGIDIRVLEKLEGYFKETDLLHSENKYKFCPYKNNCSHIGLEALLSAGIISNPPKRKQFPTAIFHAVVRSLDENFYTAVRFRIFERLQGSHKYQYENLPWPGHSRHQMLLGLIGVSSLKYKLGPVQVIGQSAESPFLLTSFREEVFKAFRPSCTRVWAFKMARSWLKGLSAEKKKKWATRFPNA